MSTSVTLRQLEYFVVTARAGTMAAAAASLHVSATAVSLGIAQLERTLGTQLLLRTRHQALALTGPGRELLADAVSIVADAEKMEARLREQAAGLHGTVYTGCFGTLAPFVVPRWVTELQQRHPDLRVEVHEDSADELQRAVLDGRSELAVLYGIDLRSGLDSVTVSEAHPYVVLPVDHRLANRRSIRLREVAKEPMILLESPPSRHHISSLLQAAGIEPRVERITHSFETLRSFVARGHGWGILVQRPASNTSYEGLPLATVAISDPVAAAPVVAAYAQGVRRSRRAEVCIDALRTVLQSDETPHLAQPATDHI
ncbi:LysR substrate-binding domain-containing protein [Desertimonas flava]|uniref:LysR substrate-binding domain-containing protein n=1 Tax=Desertimonas flava TaxID=2064846 RepID=UPI000E347A9A|nr:LysR substrate-binding domain-containing protein [Desertimonas flava]